MQPLFTINRMKAGLAGATLLLILGFAEPTRAAKFLGLGDLAGGGFFSNANGVSANGSIVVGEGFATSGGEAFRWTSGGGMVGLGHLAGGLFNSAANGVSPDGSVVVGNGISSTLAIEAFRWTSGSGMVGLGDLAGGSFSSAANGVSADGSVVVGGGNSASGAEAFRWTGGSGMVGLGDLAGGSFSSTALGVSADGSVVVGYGASMSGQEALRWTSSGGMVGLSDLVGGPFGSASRAASADGSVVVGQGNSGSGPEAFRWTSGGGMVGLGDLTGGSFFSNATGVSADGSFVVGSSTSASGQEAFYWTQSTNIQSIKNQLSQSLGAALNGWTLTSANAVSADGRTIVGVGTNPAGNTEAWLAYMPDYNEVYWFSETSGAWDSSLSWSGPFLPGPLDDVYIDPSTSITVDGPSANQTINSLTMGDEDGDGRVTLRLVGATSGDLQITQGALIWHESELVLADGRTFSTPALDNHGVVRGSGTLDANLFNRSDGEVRVASGESLVVVGGSHANSGKVEAIGGALEFFGPVTNAVSTGLITGRGATLRFQNGLINNGSLLVSFGTSDVSGDVTNSATGKIIVAGGGAATFYDDVTQNGTLQVIKVGFTNSTAVFAGAFTGSGGSSGGGDIFFLGDLRPGNSPATVNFDNNVGFGSGASLDIELGGTTPGTQYDQVHVTGQLALGGALQVSLVNSPFTPAAGNSFDILDWGTLSGTFSSLNLPSLTAGLMWNTAQLYTAGILSVFLAGDYNGNGMVDAADYTVWRNMLGQSGTGLAADGNNNHQIDAGDYGVWKAHFGETAGSGSGANANVAVPEPATAILLMIGCAAIGLFKQSRCNY